MALPEIITIRPIPEHILENLTCSECHRYLSVPPVKVYPNRQFRCGRCATTDDNGVESPNFALVMKYMKFPCVNQYEGCASLLDMSEVEDHERTCFGTRQVCPFCHEHVPSCFILVRHLRDLHPERECQGQEFLLAIDQGDREVGFFHITKKLSFVIFNFHSDFDLLAVYTEDLQNRSNIIQELHQQIQLFSIDCAKSKYTSEITPCLLQDGKRVGYFRIPVDKTAYTKGVIKCKLNVLHDTVIRVLRINNSLSQPSETVLTADVLFKDILKLIDGTVIAARPYISILNVLWSVSLQLVYDRFENTSFLSAFFTCFDDKSMFLYKVKVNATLISTDDANKTIIHQASDFMIHHNDKRKLIYESLYNTSTILKDLKKNNLLFDCWCLKMRLKIKLENFTNQLKNSVEQSKKRKLLEQNNHKT